MTLHQFTGSDNPDTYDFTRWINVADSEDIYNLIIDKLSEAGIELETIGIKAEIHESIISRLHELDTNSKKYKDVAEICDSGLYNRF